MKRFFKKYASVLYILLASALVAVIVLHSSDLPAALRAFGTLNARWLWACGGLIALYLAARAVTLVYYLGRQGIRIALADALTVTGIGQFYSAITPSSSGGQPMQVLAMHRLGVPVSTATATVSVKFIGFQCAVLVTGLVFWLAHWDMAAGQLAGMRYLVALGYLVNSALMVGVALTMVRSRRVNRVVSWCVRQLARLHIVKDQDAAGHRALELLEEYRQALSRLIAHPGQALVVLALSCLQVFSLMSVPLCLYRAFGLSGWAPADLFTLQLLLFIVAAFVPLPGAAGAQEGGFYLFFRGVFPEGEILAAMLCWRFFTYYLLMAAGLAAVVVHGLRGWLRRRRAERDGEGR